MTFGRMPIANGFLTRDQISDEYYFELAPSVCRHCNMFQLVEQPTPQRMFHENYAFFSTSSRYMEVHFRRFAKLVIDRFLAERSDPFVVELGSNDGIMLRHFKENGYRHLGIEPSKNVAEVARERGIQTLIAFFNKELADQIVEEHGRADAVLAANVMCHIPDLSVVAAGIQRLLKADGVLIFEDPYLGDVITKVAYDQIYDEHAFIFSVLSVGRAFEPHGLELIDVIPQLTHGGSMRYVLARKGIYPASANIAHLVAKERAQGLDTADTYSQFKANCEASRDRLKRTLENLCRQRQRIVGYGATSKSTTVTNYCGITADQIEFISDTTIIKQGKLSPGAHIPIKPHGEFAASYPDYALLFAWNHAAEIRRKERKFVAAGGRWIVYVPKVEIVS
jgi:methylation protein EvaC